MMALGVFDDGWLEGTPGTAAAAAAAAAAARALLLVSFLDLQQPLDLQQAVGSEVHVLPSCCRFPFHGFPTAAGPPVLIVFLVVVVVVVVAGAGMYCSHEAGQGRGRGGLLQAGETAMAATAMLWLSLSAVIACCATFTSMWLQSDGMWLQSDAAPQRLHDCWQCGCYDCHDCVQPGWQVVAVTLAWTRKFGCCMMAVRQI
jgi:hypothetical protein